MTKISYSNVVECLMYAMVMTKLDISCTMNVVSRYMANPKKEHWMAVV